MTTEKEKVKREVAETMKKLLCPTCNGDGVVVTGTPDSFVSIPCEKCMGTGKRQEKTVEEMMREPDMRERGAAMVLLNVQVHLAHFLNQLVKANTRGNTSPDTAIGMLRDTKQLIKGYEETYGEIR